MGFGWKERDTTRLLWYTLNCVNTFGHPRADASMREMVNAFPLASIRTTMILTCTLSIAPYTQYVRQGAARGLVPAPGF